jgi:hypothetical protein
VPPKIVNATIVAATIARPPNPTGRRRVLPFIADSLP